MNPQIQEVKFGWNAPATAIPDNHIPLHCHKPNRVGIAEFCKKGGSGPRVTTGKHDSFQFGNLVNIFAG